MLVYPAFKKLPPATLTVLGLVIAITGYAIRGIIVPQRWLFPLGLTYEGFTSSDYFPLFPQLGYFLIGAAIGKTAYREKRTLLPGSFRENRHCPLFLLVRAAVTVHLSAASADRLRPS